MLSLVMLTKNSGERIGKVLRQAKLYADKIYVLVDSASTDNTEEVCREYADYVEVVDTPGYIEPMLEYLYSLPDTEWILRLDDDEVLGEWFIDSCKDIMELEADAFFFPRYAMVGENKYLSNHPLYPDEQLRMFRRGKVIPSEIIHHIHRVDGPTMTLFAHIFHMKFLWKTRQEREEMIKKYDSIEIGAGSNEVFIVHQVPEEHYRGPTKECEERIVDPDIKVLNLGCGQKPKRHALNVDSVDVQQHYPDAFEGVEFTQYDLNHLPWAWPDAAFEEIVMEDVLEHLSADSLDIFNELWRVMKPDGILRIRCPSATQYGTYQDMTHRKFLVKDSFWHLDPDHEFGREFAHYTPFKWKVVRAEDIPGTYNFLVWMQKRGG